jgi:RNA polymerase-binding protein DksA
MARNKSKRERELERFRALLVEKRGRVLGDVKQLEEETLHNSQRDFSGDLSDYSYHMADVGSDASERETMLGLASSQQKLLENIDRALERIQQGNYGECELCEAAISTERLEILPESTVCIKCMRKYNL